MREKLLILGSQSPRRKEILNYFDLPFKQVSSAFDEGSVPFTGDPISYANNIAMGKALDLLPSFPNDLILTADTIVYKDGKVYGKPTDEKELSQFLNELQNGWHSVFTSLTLFDGQAHHQLIEESRVLFNPLNDQQIAIFRSKMPWHDKAGGYMIQGGGSLLIKRVEGCYYNIVGLPVNALSTLLKKINIDLWAHLKG